jgi:hypothetical protein
MCLLDEDGRDFWLMRADITLSLRSTGGEVDLRISAEDSGRTQSFINELRRIKDLSSELRCPRHLRRSDLQ